MNDKLKKISGILFYFVILIAIKPPLVQAYLDPGSGSSFIQILIAGGLSLGILSKTILNYIKNFINSITKKSSKHDDKTDEE